MGFDHQVVDPRQFGATGDGKADDSVALAKWAAALGEATIRRPLSGRAQGHFRFSTELLFAPDGPSGTVHMDLRNAAFQWDGGSGRSLTASMTFRAETNTVTREDGGDFVAEGWTVGRWVEIVGTSENDIRAQIARVSASELVFEMFTGSRVLVDETASCTLYDRIICMQFGDVVNGRKWFYSTIDGLYIDRFGAVNDHLVGLKIQQSDFMSVRDTVLAPGGEGTRCIDVPNAAEKSNSTNGLNFYNVLTAGGAEGALIQSVNFRWLGGKVQQHTSVGVTLKRCAVVTLETVDFSINATTGILLDRVGSGKIGAYFERHGPGTRGNDAKLIHAIDCAGLDFTGVNLNGVNGRGAAGTHAGYGIYLENSSGCHIRSSTGKLCQRAIVYQDANCHSNVVEPTVMKEDLPAWDNRTLQPIEDVAGNLINRAKGRALSRLPSGATNLIDPVVANWSTANGASIGGTVTDDDGGGNAAIVELPNVGPTPTSHITNTSALTSGVAMQTLYLRMLMRLVDFRVGNPQDRRSDIAGLRVYLIQTSQRGNLANAVYRLGPTWDWYELRYVGPPVDDTFDVVIEVRTSQEPINIAIDTIELVQSA